MAGSASSSGTAASPDRSAGNQIHHPGFLFGLALLALVTWAFLPTVDNDFVTYDDPDYVTSQPMVQRGLDATAVAWAFTTTDASNWHPLTWLSHMLDCQLFAANAAGHHLTSLLLHALNTLLVFVVLRSMTGASWRSFLVAALFGLHPLRVESVAWVAERKDVLSTFFWLLTLAGYAAYVRARNRHEGGQTQPEHGVHAASTPAGSGVSDSNRTPPSVRKLKRRERRAPAQLPSQCGADPTASFRLRAGPAPATMFFVLALVCFALGLMSKPMLVTLPFALLLLDYWPLARWSLASREATDSLFTQHATRITPRLTLRRLIVEKLPFFALSFAACIVTFLAQRHGGAVDAAIPLGRRCANAVVSIPRYLGKLFWPTDLAAFYPYPPHWPAWTIALALVSLLAITFVALRLRRSAPYLIMGWLWFLGTLVPVLGFVQVGQQSMADRYTYVPMLGVLVALVWGVHQLAAQRARLVRLAAMVAGIVVVTCGFLTRQQTAYWKNTEVLARHALAATGENFPAYNLLGTALLRQNKVEEAVEQFRTALKLQPNSADAHSNLAVALQRHGRREEAFEHYQLALQLRPRYPQAHFNYATALEEAGRWNEAMDHYTRTLEARPNFVDARFNLGSVLLRLERYDEAIAQFQQVLQLEPDSPDALNNLGVAFDRQGKLDEALRCYQRVVELKPDDARAFFNLGVALQRKGIIPEAVRCFEQALRLQPDYADARTNLDAILALKPRVPAAGQPAEKR